MPGDPYEALIRSDPALAPLVHLHGPVDPFSWPEIDAVTDHDPFAELVVHVLGQQISTVAAMAIHGRLRSIAGGTITDAAICAMTEEDFRAAGLSRAKVLSVRDLAERVRDGRLDLDAVAAADDGDAIARLTTVRGIGPWTAQLFLLHQLRRPDVFPAADIGLQRGAQRAFALPRRPTAAELTERAEAWRPLRSYAAGLLWAHAR